MLSLSSLLNPAPPPAPHHLLPSFLPSPTISSPATSYTDTEEILPSRISRSILPTFKMARDPVALAKSKPRGPVNYLPHESLDEASLQEVLRFKVTPFGRIQECCAHIPYNSGKKDFYEKTGRESFEVFKYDFSLPGIDKPYTVMWDYNVGLVRMTPFFKCCRYGKTMPAKMLGQNPGLKEITHSITGGAITAQGYWMPFDCARAVCATFCYEIAGAMIPLFGPSFPSECVPPGAPDFQRMVIDPHIIQEASREAEICRRDFNHGAHLPGIGFAHAVPRAEGGRPIRPMRTDFGHHHQQPSLRVDTRLLSPYSTDTETEGQFSGPESGSSGASNNVPRYMYHHPALQGHMRRPTRWTAANHIRHASHQSSLREYPMPPGFLEEEYSPPNPWLSAVPRYSGSSTSATRPSPPPLSYYQQHRRTPPVPRSQPIPRSTYSTKRPIDVEDVDVGYEGGESQNGSPAMEYTQQRRRPEMRRDRDAGTDLAERKAALLLMNLSVRDQHREQPTSRGTENHARASNVVESPDVHRTKRRRAASM